MKIIPLHQGIYHVGADKQFVKVQADKPAKMKIMNGGITIAIQPFILKSETHTILIDAGIAKSELRHGTPDILHLLQLHNLAPEDIDTILISHLHYDHFSGLFHYKNKKELNLPKARYYLQKSAVAAFLNEERYAKFKPDIEHLINTADTILVDQAQGQINSFISYQATSGHTPHHISFWIKEAEEIIFYGGDEAPQLAQMKMNYAAKYDYNGKEAMELRKEWWQQGQQEGWTFLFYHDIKTPIYKAN